jgi:acyl-CoA thioesterase
MLFSDVLGSVARDGDGWTATVTPDWLQGRSVFGGLQAALALRAIRSLVAELPLRVLQTTFIAPVPGGAIRLEARVLRSGKTTVHAEARILAGSDVAAIVIGVFGKARASAVSLAPRPRPLPPSAPPFVMPATPEKFPTFLQHFDMRWLQGALPGSGSPLDEAIIEVGVRDSGPASEEHVLAIADATPPLALAKLPTHVPGSSLTWTLEMLREGSFSSLPLAGWRLDVELVAGGGGYTSQSEVVWAPGGDPVALSRQCMVVFG